MCFSLVAFLAMIAVIGAACSAALHCYGAACSA